MDNTIIQQGSFTSTGVARTLVLRSDVDWIRTVNMSTAAAGVQNDTVEHYWQRGMAFGDAYVKVHTAASAILYNSTGLTLGTPQFYLIDSSSQPMGPAIAVTAGTNATRPVYNTGNTGPLAAGAIARVYGSAHTNLGGLDFSVDTINPNVSFRLANTIATAPGVVAGANGFWRYVAPDVATYKLFYPSNRVVANITQAANAVVTTLVDHGYTNGQAVRMNVGPACGMIQMDGLIGIVTVVNAFSFSLNIDSTAFAAFNYPLPAAVPFTPAEVVPVGIAPASNLSLADATVNQSYVGIVLGAGQGSPAGVNTNVIHWVAGKSFNV